MSSSLNIKATVKTPEIIINSSIGEMQMKGRSLPEDAIDFYQPVFKALEESIELNDQMTLVFYVEYLNTSSSSILRSMLEMCNSKKETGKIDLKIIWHFEREDVEMEEMGQHFKQTIKNLPIEFVEVETI